MMTRLTLLAHLWLAFAAPAFAARIFAEDEPIAGGLPVLEMSGTFAEIYEKLDGVKWAGKDVRVAVESSVEGLAPGIHAAATDRRIVLLHKDDIIGNWDRPSDGNWSEYGQITAAMVLKLRERLPELAALGAPEIYNAAIASIMKGIDKNGRYIYSKKEELQNDPHVLTSLGIAGVRTSAGDYLLNTIFKGSPADNAGLSDGDILVSANGTALRDLSDMEVLGLFNGFSSGTIKVRAIGSDKKEKSAAIRRASIVMADADIVVRDTILEIIIHKITDNAVDVAAEAIDKYKHDGIYLDLRGATGDDELAMAKMAGLFMGKIPIAKIARTAQEELEIIPGGDAMTQAPVVVATSNATSGSAEGLAYAFYEAGRAVLIGVPTAGKAMLSTRIDLKSGGALELKNREIKSGRGNTINGRGFFPPICLSNIRTSEQKNVFLVNVRNHEWSARDFNKENIDPKSVRKGCPNITSGADEDAVASAVAFDILLGEKVYDALLQKN